MPTIIVSGQPGSGNSTTARLLAKTLNLKHWSAGDYLKKFGEGKETERAVTAWEGEAGKKEFHVKLDAKLVEVAKAGDVVIDAKMGIHFAKDFADLTVWVKCPADVRAERVAQRDDITLDKAKKVLAEKEHIELVKYREMYGVTMADQEKDADLSIDTSTLKPEEVVAKICLELKKRKIVN